MFKNQKSVCGSPGGDLFPLIFRGAGIEVVQQIHEHPQKPHQSHSAIGLRGWPGMTAPIDGMTHKKNMIQS